MENINIKKRTQIKKALFGLGILGYLSISPINALKDMSSQEINEKIIKDEKGRIIKIIQGNKVINFNPENPMEYNIK